MEKTSFCPLCGAEPPSSEVQVAMVKSATADLDYWYSYECTDNSMHKFASGHNNFTQYCSEDGAIALNTTTYGEIITQLEESYFGETIMLVCAIVLSACVLILAGIFIFYIALKF